MANELNIALPTSGLTVTAQPYQSGSAVGSAISLTEVGSTGFYSGTMTGSAGTYQLAFISAGANVGSGSIVWSGTAEVPASTFNPATDTVANVTLCATTTTLTNAPTVPSAEDIASEVRSELATELANLDATVSSRLATSGYTAPTSAPSVADIRTELAVELGRLDASVSSRLAGSSYTAPPTPPTAAEITSAVWAAADKTGYSLTSAERTALAAAVEGSILNEGDGQQVLNAIVGAIGNTNLSEVSLVAAVRADLERNGGKLDSIPTTAAPSASAVASATRTELSTELSRIDQAISSRLASASYVAPSTPPTVVEIRQEIDANSTKLDAAISSRMAASEATKLDAVKVKTDGLNIERLSNVATTNIVGTLLAQANS